MAEPHCTACHQFLAGKEAGLEPKREVCLGCHPQVAADKKHFERDLTKCVSCHRPHTWKARAGPTVPQTWAGASLLDSAGRRTVLFASEAPIPV